jgi:hypothetical protein
MVFLIIRLRSSLGLARIPRLSGTTQSMVVVWGTSNSFRGDLDSSRELERYTSPYDLTTNNSMELSKQSGEKKKQKDGNRCIAGQRRRKENGVEEQWREPQNHQEF